MRRSWAAACSSEPRVLPWQMGWTAFRALIVGVSISLSSLPPNWCAHDTTTRHVSAARSRGTGGGEGGPYDSFVSHGGGVGEDKEVFKDVVGADGARRAEHVPNEQLQDVGIPQELHRWRVGLDVLFVQLHATSNIT